MQDVFPSSRRPLLALSLPPALLMARMVFPALLPPTLATSGSSSCFPEGPGQASWPLSWGSRTFLPELLLGRVKEGSFPPARMLVRPGVGGIWPPGAGQEAAPCPLRRPAPTCPLSPVILPCIQMCVHGVLPATPHPPALPRAGQGPSSHRRTVTECPVGGTAFSSSGGVVPAQSAEGEAAAAGSTMALYGVLPTAPLCCRVCGRWVCGQLMFLPGGGYLNRSAGVGGAGTLVFSSSFLSHAG